MTDQVIIPEFFSNVDEEVEWLRAQYTLAVNELVEYAKLAARGGEGDRIRAALASDTAIEELAALSHTQWAGWTKWMFDKIGEVHQNGEPFLRRWERQMVTPYAALSETEKDSDRTEAKRMLEVIHGLIK